MKTQIVETEKNTRRSTSSSITGSQGVNTPASKLVDNRPQAIAQRKLLEMVSAAGKPQEIVQKRKNNTGLPDQLKAGLENLSGYSMDDVRVHYNSSKPAQLQAHAYAQGAEIHLGVGQEKHLPHEAWHVVQQKQGRVKATLQMKGLININDDEGLEKEADVMGNMATSFQLKTQKTQARRELRKPQHQTPPSFGVVQAKWIHDSKNELRWDKSRSGLIWYYNTSTRKMRFEPARASDLVGLEKLKGVEKSYRAWITDWQELKHISPARSEGLSFSNYISHIIEIYPPAKFDYIGIGASCDLVLGYMARKYGLKSANIPISGVTNVSIERKDWKSEERKRVIKYISAFIPGFMLKGSKKLLLLDVTSGGTTLVVMEQLIKELLKEHGQDGRRVTSFSLNSTIKPDSKLFTTSVPDVLSKPVPMDPHDVEERKPTAEQIKAGFMPAGTVVEEDHVMLDYEEDQAILKRIKKLKKRYRKLDTVKDKVERSRLKKRASKLEASRHKKEYYPKGFGVMISDTTEIEDKLDAQEYKKLGRSHRKVDVKKIMSGETDAKTEMAIRPEKNHIQEKIGSLLEHEKD